MNISTLKEKWFKTNFSYQKYSLIPKESGVYAITNYKGDILYIGISINLKKRFSDHIDSNKFHDITPIGKSYWFYYILKDPQNHRKFERGLIHHIELFDGALPWFNKYRPP